MPSALGTTRGETIEGVEEKETIFSKKLFCCSCTPATQMGERGMEFMRLECLERDISKE